MLFALKSTSINKSRESPCMKYFIDINDDDDDDNDDYDDNNDKMMMMTR